jgi:hypothetical protein
MSAAAARQPNGVPPLVGVFFNVLHDGQKPQRRLRSYDVICKWMPVLVNSTPACSTWYRYLCSYEAAKFYTVGVFQSKA